MVLMGKMHAADYAQKLSYCKESRAICLRPWFIVYWLWARCDVAWSIRFGALVRAACCSGRLSPDSVASVRKTIVQQEQGATQLVADSCCTAPVIDDTILYCHWIHGSVVWRGNKRPASVHRDTTAH